MLTLVWSFLTSRLGGWLAAGVAVLILLGLLKWEHAAKVRAQEKLATQVLAYEILNQGYLQLYQDREKIKTEAATQRRKIDELLQRHDYDGLSDTFNRPGGVREPGASNPRGGPTGLTRYHDSAGTEFTD